jgi:ABC-type cobalamin/Fe3+-siderophores transport system ATPase subunit
MLDLALYNISDIPMPISLSIRSMTFSGGDTLALPENGITVIVGPNNSGKTSTIRELRRVIRDGASGPVVANVALKRIGSENDVIRMAG